jgi:hypothetical protein
MTNTRRTGPLDYKTQYNFEEFYKKHYGQWWRGCGGYRPLRKEAVQLQSDVEVDVRLVRGLLPLTLV